MKTAQLRFAVEGGWSVVLGELQACRGAQLVLVFADRTLLETGALVQPLKERFPDARIVACSGGAEIQGDGVFEKSAVATALMFEHSSIFAVQREIRSATQSFAVGFSIGRELPPEGLRHVLIFSEGLNINGSALAEGVAKALPANVAVTGGLAADGERFEKTVVALDDTPLPGNVVAIGLYGERLRIGMGSLGGWKTRGSRMKVTRSEGNILFALDGKPALPAYKKLIGKHAYGLPASGLLYPLLLDSPESSPGVVRTLLSVDEENMSLTFAGDVPEGRYATLMRADLDTVIDAAGIAASRSMQALDMKPDFALLISCIGRKLVLQQRTHEEVKSARVVFGPQAVFTGFYSYGELSPLNPSAKCELHNQTMTITTVSEV